MKKILIPLFFLFSFTSVFGQIDPGGGECTIRSISFANASCTSNTTWCVDVQVLGTDCGGEMWTYNGQSYAYGLGAHQICLPTSQDLDLGFTDPDIDDTYDGPSTIECTYPDCAILISTDNKYCSADGTEWCVDFTVTNAESGLTGFEIPSLNITQAYGTQVTICNACVAPNLNLSINDSQLTGCSTTYTETALTSTNCPGCEPDIVVEVNCNSSGYSACITVNDDTGYYDGWSLPVSGMLDVDIIGGGKSGYNFGETVCVEIMATYPMDFDIEYNLGASSVFTHQVTATPPAPCNEPCYLFNISVDGPAALCPDATGILMAAAMNAQGTVTYAWSTGDTGEMVSVMGPGVYTVTAMDNGGCSTMYQITVPEQAVCDGSGCAMPIMLSNYDMSNCLENYATYQTCEYSQNGLEPNTQSADCGQAGGITNVGISCNSCYTRQTYGKYICYMYSGIGSDYVDNHPGATTFTYTTNAGDAGMISQLSFMYQPDEILTTQTNPSGCPDGDSYFQKFGMRVLRDGIEIYRETDITVIGDMWQTLSFSFPSDPNFNYVGMTTYTFELLGYDPTVSCGLFEIDNVRLYGCCDQDATASCAMSVPTINTTCDDNGTPNDPSDDTYSFTINTPDGTSTGSMYALYDPTISPPDGPFSQTNPLGTVIDDMLIYGVEEGPFGPYDIADGDTSIVIYNITNMTVDKNCRYDTIVIAPDPCSNIVSCSIGTPVINTTCDNAGTPENATDDTFSYTIFVSGTNTSTCYNISGEDTQTGVAFGETSVSYGPFDITDGDLNITLTDCDDSNCTLSNVIVTAPNTCSDDCLLSVEIGDNQLLCDSTQINLTASVTGASTCTVPGNCTVSTSTLLLNYDFEDCANGDLSPTAVSTGDCITVVGSDFNVSDSAYECGSGHGSATGMDQTSYEECDLATLDASGVPYSNMIFTMDPGTAGSLDEITFWYRAKAEDGTSKMLVRVYSGATLLYEEVEIDLFGAWVQYTIDLTGVIGSDFTSATTFRLEVQAYCASIVGAVFPSVNSFLIDQIQVTGGCCTDPNQTSNNDVTYEWSTGATTPSISVNPTTQTNYSVTVTDCNDCEATDIMTVSFVEINETITTTCNDNGTPSNPDDDTFSYSITVNGTNTSTNYNISGDDTEANLSYGTTNGPYGPFNIADGALSINITDNGSTSCTKSLSILPPATCSNTTPCSIGTPVISVTCDDAGTPTIPGDDTFSYTINTSGTGTGSCYNISGGDTQTNVSYGSVSASYGPFPISGGNLSLTLTDCDDSGCTQTATVTAPSPCSNTIPCSIGTPVISVSCDDAGTPTVPGDDTFSYTINTSGTGTGSCYNISGGDTQTNVSYGSESASYGPFPISGGNLSLTLTDCDDSGCTQTATVTAPSPCSNITPCSIGTPVISVSCDDAGTPTVPGDDTFSYTINTSGTGTGSCYNISGGDTQTNVSYGSVSASYGPFPISGGSLSLTLTDCDDSGCTQTATVTAPSPCSNTTPCSIGTPVISVTCDNAGTPTVPGDDTFSYTINTSGTGTGSCYNISGGDTQTNVSYGSESASYGPFPISGGNLSLTLTDCDDSACTQTATVTAPSPCSNTTPCSIGTPVISVTCDDAGTPTIPGDDTFSYTINTSGTGTGSCYDISGGDTQANVSYGSVSTSYGPFPISGGNLSLTLTDCDDSGCTQTATVTAPSPCSNTTPCSIGTPVISVTCDDAGTPTIPGDDTFSYAINTTGTGVGSCYDISGGDTQTNVSYGSVSASFGPFPISGGNLSLTLADCDDSGCTQTATVTAPSPCSNINCPTIPAPTNPNNPTICLGETVPELSVTAETGFTYSWYSTATGGTALTTNTTATYTPTGITGAGTYAYFVEAASTNDPLCPPSARTEVSLAVYDAPQLSNATISQCDFSGGQEFYAFDLTSVEGDIVSGTGFTIAWYSDATLTTSIATPTNYLVSGNETVYAEVTDANNCSSIAEVSLFVNVYQPPIFGTVCNDQGTPNDSSDDTFTFTLTIDGPIGVVYTFSGDASGSGQYQEISEPFGPFPIAGGDVEIVISGGGCDDLDLTIQAPDVCSQDCPTDNCLGITVTKTQN